MYPDHAQHIRSLPSLDADYCFGRPKVYLTHRELARLTLVRSTLGDTRAERETEGAASGAPSMSKENDLP